MAVVYSLDQQCPQDIPGFIRMRKRSIFENISRVLKESGIRRASRLTTPIERLEDHNGEILTCEFHPHGELLMSAGLRQQIHICSVFGEEGRVMILRGHWGSIIEAHFSSDGLYIYSCSLDESLGIWDSFTGIRTSHLKGHSGCVNTVQCSRKGLPILCSGGDDCTLRIWDVREQMNRTIFQNGECVTAACFDDAGEHIFSAGVGPDIKIWDVRLNDVVLRLRGHHDAVTGLALSPCGSYLLSHSLDNTLRIWNIRPTFTGERCIQVFQANQHIVNGNLLRCAWSPDGTMVSAGTADEDVPLWNRIRGFKMTELPGHQATVNDVDFHPIEPIIASGSSDNYVFLHEIVK